MAGRGKEYLIDEGIEPFMVLVVFVISIKVRGLDDETSSVLCKVLFFEENVCLLCCDIISWYDETAVSCAREYVYYGYYFFHFLCLLVSQKLPQFLIAIAKAGSGRLNNKRSAEQAKGENIVKWFLEIL